MNKTSVSTSGRVAKTLPSKEKRRRGRPRLSEVAALHQRIISTARELFHERGFADTTMEAVAYRSRISKGTLYLRFPKKSDLFVAVFEEQIRQWWDDANLGHRPGTSWTLVEMLQYRGEQIIETSLSPEFISVRGVLNSVRTQFPELVRMFHSVVGREAAALADELQAIATAEQITCRDPKIVTSAFVSTLVGWTNDKILSGEAKKVTKKERKAWVERVVAILIEGSKAW